MRRWQIATGRACIYVYKIYEALLHGRALFKFAFRFNYRINSWNKSGRDWVARFNDELQFTLLKGYERKNNRGRSDYSAKKAW